MACCCPDLQAQAHQLSKNPAHLIFIGPEGTDGQLSLVPLPAMGSSHIPHSTAQRAPVDTHIDAQGAGAVPVPAIEEVAELNTVRVVLTQGLENDMGPLARSMLGSIDHQVGTWREKKTRQGDLRESQGHTEEGTEIKDPPGIRGSGCDQSF